MASKKDVAEQVERRADESRKAYGLATTALRAAHKDEFADLLDQAYESLGLESPRAKREKSAAARKALQDSIKARKASKAAERLAKAREALAEAERAASEAGLQEEFADLAEAIESVVTADQ